MYMQGKPLSGTRILLAEDGKDNQLFFTTVLRKVGAEIALVENGLDAVKAINANSPGHFDIVLMDMQMPVLDGYAATRRLRQENCTVPIIALTASALKEQYDQCMTAGCDAFLSKPIPPYDLVKAIREYLDRQSTPVKGERHLDSR